MENATMTRLVPRENLGSCHRQGGSRDRKIEADDEEAWMLLSAWIAEKNAKLSGAIALDSRASK